METVYINCILRPREHYKRKQEYTTFCFQIFFAKGISGLIDETLEKICLFNFKEVDGIGLISALMVLTKLKMHLDFLDDEQASILVERSAKKKKEKRKDCDS